MAAYKRKGEWNAWACLASGRTRSKCGVETEEPLDNQLSMILGSFSAKHRKQAIPGFLTLCNLIPCLSSCQLAFTEHPSNAQHCPRVTGEVKAVHLPMRNLWSWWGGQTTVPRKTPQSTQDHGEASVSDCALGARWCNPVLRPERGRQGGAPARGRGWRLGDPRLAASGPAFGAELVLQRGRKASPVTFAISCSFSATTCSTLHCSRTTGEAKRKNKWLWGGLEHTPRLPPSHQATFCGCPLRCKSASSGKEGGGGGGRCSSTVSESP